MQIQDGKSLSVDQSPALRASGVTKASGGALYHIYVDSQSASTEFFQLFDLAAVPVDTTVPKMSYPVRAGQTLVIPLPSAEAFVNGICWCESTTEGTKTIAGTPKFKVRLSYR